MRNEDRKPSGGSLAELAELRRKALVPAATEADVLAYADRLTGLLGVWPERAEATEVLVHGGVTPGLAEHAWDLYRTAGGWPALATGSLTTFTRLVEPDAGVPAPPPAPHEPLEVLFAIAPGVEASRVQPAEEYVGLVRAAGARGVELRVSLLRDATPTELRKEIELHQPDVVHVVAHGRVGGRLALGVEVDAAALAAALLVGPKVPWLVVLNACYSAGSTGMTDPLAAGLVRRGLPSVVAMGDAVNDRVARTFAWRFYDALAAREPLPLAVARGRLAVVAEGFSPPKSFEWARPALFRRPDASLAVLEDPAWRVRAQAVTTLRGDDRPRVLGDRHWLFEKPWRDLMRLNEERIVLLHTPREHLGHKLGRSRILRELGAALVRDGHLVTHVLQPGNGAEMAGIRDVLRAFDRALVNARTRHDLPSTNGVLARLARLASGKPPGEALPPKVDDAVDGTNVPFPALSLALRYDLEALWNDARQQNVVAEGAGQFLLIDELERYGSFAAGLAQMLREPYAAGPAKRPIGIAVTLGPSSSQGGNEAADRAIQDLTLLAGGGRFVLYPVEKLRAPEARAALVHWLLGNYASDGSRAPLWTNPKHDNENQESVLNALLDKLDGCPGKAPEVEGLFEFLVKTRSLVPASAAIEVALHVGLPGPQDSKS